MEAHLFHEDGRKNERTDGPTDKQADSANSCFRIFNESAYNRVCVTFKVISTKHSVGFSPKLYS
jgi:hypothetical protein